MQPLGGDELGRDANPKSPHAINAFFCSVFPRCKRHATREDDLGIAVMVFCARRRLACKLKAAVVQFSHACEAAIIFLGCAMAGVKKMVFQRRKFSDAFKQEAGRQALLSGIVIAEFGKSIGIHESLLRRWIKELGLGSQLAEQLPGNAVIALEIESQKARLAQSEQEQKILINVLTNFNHQKSEQG